MPRPNMPPTPGSSSDIKGLEGPQFGFSQISFELPPPAITNSDSRPSSASTKSSSASSYHPTSPKSPTMVSPGTARRRSSAATAAKDAFALPPPPSRSRKIIQMKPKGQPEEVAEVDSASKSATGKSPAGQKKKQPSATSVAGRKIARKTAHSLIERRRRSKMNEEFGVLKNMIPACTGEMHKLAILQASIDYVRYLEDCVAKLKAQNSSANHGTPTPATQEYVPTNRESYEDSRQYAYEDEDEGSDVEMENPEAVSPNYQSAPTPTTHSHSHQPSVSPALVPQDRQRHDSYSSASASLSNSTSHDTDRRNYSYSTSATTSPAFGPQSGYDYAISNASVGSALTSPALLPQRGGSRDLDQEATAALLMLNTDRRGTHGSISGQPGERGRGMSVRDLLSA